MVFKDSQDLREMDRPVRFPFAKRRMHREVQVSSILTSPAIMRVQKQFVGSTTHYWFIIFHEGKRYNLTNGFLTVSRCEGGSSLVYDLRTTKRRSNPPTIPLKVWQMAYQLLMML